MTIVDHAEALERFSAYWDDELPTDEAAALEAHLGVCESCRAEYAAFERTMGSLGALGAEAAPSGFVPGVIDRVRRRSRGRFFARRGWRERAPYELFSLVMLALLVALYLAVRFAQPALINAP